jgi:hypothetical protein
MSFQTSKKDYSKMLSFQTSKKTKEETTACNVNDIRIIPNYWISPEIWI